MMKTECFFEKSSRESRVPKKDWTYNRCIFSPRHVCSPCPNNRPVLAQAPCRTSAPWRKVKRESALCSTTVCCLRIPFASPREASRLDHFPSPASLVRSCPDRVEGRGLASREPDRQDSCNKQGIQLQRPSWVSDESYQRQPIPSSKSSSNSCLFLVAIWQDESKLWDVAVSSRRKVDAESVLWLLSSSLLSFRFVASANGSMSVGKNRSSWKSLGSEVSPRYPSSVTGLSEISADT